MEQSLKPGAVGGAAPGIAQAEPAVSSALIDLAARIIYTQQVADRISTICGRINGDPSTPTGEGARPAPPAGLLNSITFLRGELEKANEQLEQAVSFLALNF